MRKLLFGGSVAALLVSGFGAAGALSLHFPDTLQSKSTTTPVDGKVTQVVVNGQVGDVIVQAGPAATVATHQEWNLLGPTVTQSFNNGVLTVTTRCPNLPENNCSVDVTVTVPPPVGVSVTEGVGDVTTRNLVGNEALATSVGRVEVRNLRAARLDVLSNTGDVDVALPTAPATTNLRSDVGDIVATVPAGAYALKAGSQIGEVQIVGVTNNPASGHSITAQSQTGDVTITGK